MSRAPRDIDELLELAGDDPKDFADTLEADGRAEGDPTKVEEARMVRRTTSAQRRAAKAKPKASSAPPKQGTPNKALSRASKQQARAKNLGTKARARTAKPRATVATTVDQGGSLFWSIALGTVALILLSLVVRNAPTATRMFDTIAGGVRRVTFPQSVFPDKWGAVAPTSAPANRQPTRKA